MLVFRTIFKEVHCQVGWCQPWIGPLDGLVPTIELDRATGWVGLVPTIELDRATGWVGLVPTIELDRATGWVGLVP